MLSKKQIVNPIYKICDLPCSSASAIALDIIMLSHMHEDHFDRMVEQMNSALLNSTF
jgi:L-ascorbate metabolism protein UlaG (beta-lactamase superfamily)